MFNRIVASRHNRVCARIVSLLAFASVVTGCSSLEYSYRSEPDFPSDVMGSYQVVTDWSGESSIQLDPGLRNKLNEVLGEKLETLGYLKSFPAQPAFVLSYRLESSWDPSLSKEEIRQKTGFSGSHFPDADPRARDYQRFTLIIEAGSPFDKKIFWSGQAEGVQYRGAKSAADVIDAAEEIMEKFPISVAEQLKSE